MSNTKKPTDWGDIGGGLILIAMSVPFTIAFRAWTLQVLLGWVGVPIAFWAAVALRIVIQHAAIDPPDERTESKDESLIVNVGTRMVLELLVGLVALALSATILWACGWPQLVLP